MGKISLIIPLLFCVRLFTGSLVSADVNVSVAPNCNSFTMNNATLIPWRLGGARLFDRRTFWTSAADGEGNGWNMFHQTAAGRVQQDLYYESYAAPAIAPAGCTLVPGTSAIFTCGYSSGTDTAYPDAFVLLHTGGAGVPDGPVDAAPLTLAQLDSVISVPGYGDSTYRYGYADGLGVNGGPYSGGFIDTWRNQKNGNAETQIHFPVPASAFTVNGISVNFIASGLDYYWMSLALCQEYFHVDMQWSAAQGAKETGIGTSFLVLPADQKGIYGYWQIGNASGLDRALSYPGFFPKFSSRLSAARNAAASGINADTLMTYYARGNRGVTPFNSALMLNSCLVAMLFQYVNYDICSYATDICWKNSLATAIDPYLGVSFMAIMYNLGESMETGEVAALLNPNTYQQTCANPNAHTLLGTGSSNYVPDILAIVGAEADASKQFETNGASLTLVDFPIGEREIMDMFFGDTGTVAKQGNGGLLLHYYDPAAGNCAAMRRTVWNTLDSAFSMLKGHSPSSTPTTISFRYDFLILVRSVKQYFPFVRQQPVGGDAALSITANSGNYQPCRDSVDDETYPYLTASVQSLENNDFYVTDTVRDSISVKEIQWTLDNSWKIWNYGTLVSAISPTEKIFGFTLPQSDIAFWRDSIGDSLSGRMVWIMATDSSGNSCIGKYPVAATLPVLMRPATLRAQSVSIAKVCGRIAIRLSQSGFVGWALYDMEGHLIAFEKERNHPAGTFSPAFPALAHGIYVLQFHGARMSPEPMKFVY